MMHLSQDRSLIQEIKARPIILAIFAIWALEASMNTLFGYRQGGGGVAALGYASMYFAIAVLAAWLPTRFSHISGVSAADWFKWCGVLAMTLLCIGISQMAGWSVMGVTLADGAAKRETQATIRSTAKEKLDQARADRKSLGTQQAPDQVKARIDAEFSTVVKRTGQTIGEITNHCADISQAPGSCSRVQKLKVDLAAAERAAALDATIEAAGGKLDAAPAVAEGDPSIAIIVAITGASEADVRFWRVVFLEAALGLFANLGFAIVNIGHHAPANVARSPSPDWTWQPPKALVEGPPVRAALVSPFTATVARPASVVPEPAQSHLVSPEVPLVSEQATTQPQLLAIATRSLPSQDVPVDREHVRRLSDGLLVFRASALVDQPGSAVALHEVYERYRPFAGPYAVSRETFENLLPSLTGIRCALLNEQPHLFDIAFKNVALAA